MNKLKNSFASCALAVLATWFPDGAAAQGAPSPSPAQPNPDVSAPTAPAVEPSVPVTPPTAPALDPTLVVPPSASAVDPTLVVPPGAPPVGPTPVAPPGGTAISPIAPAALPPPPAPVGVAPAASERAPGPTFTLAPGKGFTVASADERYSLNLRARVQLRTTLGRDDDTTTLEAQVRTLRFFIAGNVLVPELKYLIQFAFGANDFDKDSSSPIFDAYVEYVKIRDLNVRAGQYFVPFDRARTIREFALQFVDRQAVVRELSLDRDVGIMFSSTDLFGLGGRLAYNAFIGGGDGRNRIATSSAVGPQKPGVLLIGRITVRPFGPFDDDMEGDLTRASNPRLAIGAAAGYNFASDRDKSTYGNTYTLGTFDYAHTAADLVFKWRGLSLLTEFLYRKADRETHTGTSNGQMLTERSRSGYGYFVQGGQLLTSRLELTARWEELKGTDRALKDVARASGRQVGGGMNFYVNGHFFKLQSDYFYAFGEQFRHGAHVARLQLDATF